MWKRIWLFALALSALAPQAVHAHPGHEHGGLAGGPLHHLLTPLVWVVLIGVVAATLARPETRSGR